MALCYALVGVFVIVGVMTISYDSTLSIHTPKAFALGGGSGGGSGGGGAGDGGGGGGGDAGGNDSGGSNNSGSSGGGSSSGGSPGGGTGGGSGSGNAGDGGGTAGDTSGTGASTDSGGSDSSTDSGGSDSSTDSGGSDSSTDSGGGDAGSASDSGDAGGSDTPSSGSSAPSSDSSDDGGSGGGDDGDDGGDSGDDGGSGGGGGAPGGDSFPGGSGVPSTPDVSMSFERANAQPLSFITLSQIPVTGFGNGTVARGVFWLLLIFWSVLIAAFVLVERLRTRLARFITGAAPAIPSPFLKGNGKEDEKEVAPAATSSEEKLDSSISREEHGVLIFERHAGEHMPRLRLREESPHENGAVELDGKRELSHAPVDEYAGNNDGERVSAVESAIPEREAPAMHAGDLHTHQGGVTAFAQWVAAADGRKAFDLLRRLNKEGHDILNFLGEVLCVVGDTYRDRRDGGFRASDEVHIAFANWSEEGMEDLLDTLSAAIDGTYSSDYTAGKLSTTQALALARREQQKIDRTA